MLEVNVPGLAIGLAKNGEVQFTKAFGFTDIEKRRRVTTKSMFHIASITKTITATAIVQLAEKGALALNDAVAKYCDFPVINPHHPENQITIEQLLNHTSTISDEKAYEVDFRTRGTDSNITLFKLLTNYLTPDGSNYSTSKCYSKEKPGSNWSYSNIGYSLLGYIVGRVGQSNLRQQSRTRIFNPLKMRDTSWTIADTPENLRVTPYELDQGIPSPVEPVGFPDWPAGMLRSSVDDLTKFVAASANGGKAQGFPMLTQSSMDAMLNMHDIPRLPDWLSGQGLGWGSSDLNGVPVPNHWGGDPGVFTAAYIDPDKRTGVTILMNVSANVESRHFLKALASRMLTLSDQF